MKPAGVATAALVLRRFDYSESSQIARLYTRELGRVSVLAKGSRRPNPDILGALDLFCLGDAVVHRRAPDSLQLLTHWNVRTGFPELRRRLDRMFAAFYLCELLHEGVRDFDPDPALFDFWAACFAALERADPRGVAAVTFRAELGYLDAAGFAPNFAACVGCGRTPPAPAETRFSPGRGGVVCGRCLAPDTPGLVALSAGRRRALLRLRDTQPEHAAVLRFGAADVAALRALFDRLLERALECPLHAAKYLRTDAVATA